jgi:hypothetical protein
MKFVDVVGSEVKASTPVVGISSKEKEVEGDCSS